MRVDLNLLLLSKDLYQDVVQHFSSQEHPEKTVRMVNFPNGLRVELLNGRTAISQWADMQAGSSNKAQIAFLDDRYPVLETFLAHGIKAIWYNPRGEMAPEPLPVQDLDILSFDELLEDLSSLRIPTLSQCLTWWDEWELLENVRQHSYTVSRAAYQLAIMMRNKGLEIDPILTHRGGLLHDLDKIETLRSSGAHGKKAAAFIEKKGYPEVAVIVREHIMSTILNPNADNRSWEVKLVYFCDKLAEGDQLVPFNQRLSALYERYPDYRNIMQQAEGPIWLMSDQICSILSIPNHESLIAMLKGLQNQ